LNRKQTNDGGTTPFERQPKRPSIYGLHQPYDRGYGVTHRDTNLRQRRQKNAQFVNQLNEDVWFYVDDFEANFEVTGSTAQSKKTRQFYPHNMAQPSVTVTGVAPSNHFYNELASFVRAAQYYSVSGRELRMAGLTTQDYRTMTGPSGKPIYRPTMQFNLYARNQKSAPHNKLHLSWKLEGYVKNIRAGGEKANVAPTFTFEFIIAEVSGHEKHLFDDDLVRGRAILSWMDVFKSAGGKGWIQNPEQPVRSNKDKPEDFDTQIQQAAGQPGGLSTL
jgi:hypothetical protein